MNALAGVLVADLTRYVPGAFASRELRRLGARVVRIEPPDGDPMRATAPGWHDALNAGAESVVCDLKSEPELARALCTAADVVLESFRPGVAARLGVGPDDVPERVVYCSLTGFGEDDRRAGHDLNYLGWAGALWDTAPSLPPVQAADLAAGGQQAVIEVLAALLRGGGARIVVSMTHGSHALVAGRPPGLLTGGLACYRIYETGDARHLTVAALEPKFFKRLCELLGRPELAERQYGDDQEALAGELGSAFRAQTLAAWLELFDGEDVCVGPVASPEEAADSYDDGARLEAPSIGQHTAEWRRQLGL
jgi:alpha-methylacyl-CoA racemase